MPCRTVWHAQQSYPRLISFCNRQEFCFRKMVSRPSFDQQYIYQAVYDTVSHVGNENKKTKGNKIISSKTSRTRGQSVADTRAWPHAGRLPHRQLLTRRRRASVIGPRCGRKWVAPGEGNVTLKCVHWILVSKAVLLHSVRECKDC